MTEPHPHQARIREIQQLWKDRYWSPELGPSLTEIVTFRPLTDEIFAILKLGLESYLPGHKERAVKACLSLEDEAVPLLEYLLEHSAKIRNNAAFDQVFAGLHSLIPDLEDRLQTLLQSEIYNSRIHAVRTMTMLPSISDETIDALFARAKQEQALLIPCLRALARQAPPTGANWKRLQSLAKTKGYRVEAETIHTMGAIAFPYEKKLQHFGGVLKNKKKDPHARKEAALQLARLGTQAAQDVLLTQLSVLAQLYSSYHFPGNADLYRVMLPIVHHDPSVMDSIAEGLRWQDPSLVERTARLLARFDKLPKKFYATITGMLKNHDPARSKGAARAMLQLYAPTEDLLPLLLGNLGKPGRALGTELTFPLPAAPSKLPESLKPPNPNPEVARLLVHLEKRYAALDPTKAAMLHALFPQAIGHKQLQAAAIAAQLLAKQGQEVCDLMLPRLREALKSPYRGTRTRAAQLLAALGTKAADAFPALAQALQDHTAQVRQHVLRALLPFAELALPLVPQIIRKLHETREHTQHAAQDLLIAIRDRAPQELRPSFDALAVPASNQVDLQDYLRQGPLQATQLRELAFAFTDRTIWHYHKQKLPLDDTLLLWFQRNKYTTQDPSTTKATQPPDAQEEAEALAPAAQEAQSHIRQTILAALQEDPVQAACDTMQATRLAAQRSEQRGWPGRKPARVPQERSWQIAKTFEMLMQQHEGKTIGHWKEQFEDALF